MNVIRSKGRDIRCPKQNWQIYLTKSKRTFRTVETNNYKIFMNKEHSVPLQGLHQHITKQYNTGTLAQHSME